MKGHESFNKNSGKPTWITAHPRKTYFEALWLAQPVWADRQAIYAVYAEARRKAVQLGPGIWSIVVDHIVPLNSPKVCGLHVPDNLRVVCHYTNSAKSNDTWPDMWDEQVDWVEHKPHQQELRL